MGFNLQCPVQTLKSLQPPDIHPACPFIAISCCYIARLFFDPARNKNSVSFLNTPASNRPQLNRLLIIDDSDRIPIIFCFVFPGIVTIHVIAVVPKILLGYLNRRLINRTFCVAFLTTILYEWKKNPLRRDSRTPWRTIPVNIWEFSEVYLNIIGIFR
jgi:hypothetical protein